MNFDNPKDIEEIIKWFNSIYSNDIIFINFEMDHFEVDETPETPNHKTDLNIECKGAFSSVG